MENMPFFSILSRFLVHFRQSALPPPDLSNNQDESGKLRKLAKKYSLALTGGSDFHGAAKPDIEIGSGRGGLRVSALYLDDIKLSMFMAGVGRS